jgi:hypothetical protein
MKPIGVLVLWFVGMCMFGCASTANAPRSSSDAVPLPPNVRIIPPDANLLPDVRAFSGKWFGAWETGRKIMLVVERLDQSEADVIFAWASRGGDTPDWRRLNGRVEPGTLTLNVHRTTGDATITFHLQVDDTLDATFQTDGRMWTGRLKRLE